jgi:hypothetical protein
MDSVNTSTQEGAVRYVELRAEYESVGQEIKALNARAGEYQKQIQIWLCLRWHTLEQLLILDSYDYDSILY